MPSLETTFSVCDVVVPPVLVIVTLPFSPSLMDASDIEK